MGLAGGNAVGRIVLRLRTSLAARWPCGACVDGRFSLADGVVATAFTVTPPAAHEPGTSRR